MASGFSGFSQTLKISGEVFQKNQVYREDLEFIPISDSFRIEPVNKFVLYLSEEANELSKRELVFESDTCTFNIKIPAKKTKKYKYLEFSSIEHITYIKIDTLQAKEYKIVLAYVPVLIKKPAIYLYPETEQTITVLHDFKGEITTTYPAYNNGWKVIAKPDGKIYNLSDKRQYPYLFWEGQYEFPKAHYRFKDGFYVEKKNYIEFLQIKLSAIGLNETEITDFIMFWLPELNRNPFSFIHFRVNDNIDNTSFLNIQPEPQSLLRVFMEFKGLQNLNDSEKLHEQKLSQFQRIGFTAVEWGGTEIF
jgi:hypothetical protein